MDRPLYRNKGRKKILPHGTLDPARGSDVVHPARGSDVVQTVVGLRIEGLRDPAKVGLKKRVFYTGPYNRGMLCLHSK